MECRSIGHFVQSTDIIMGGGGGGHGLPRDLGSWRFCAQVRAVQFGVVVFVAGAPLPTEIRLISQELPKKRRRASSVRLGRSGPYAWQAHVVKHFTGIVCRCSPLRRGSQLSMPCMYFTQCPSIEVVFEPSGLEPVEPKIPLPLPAHEPENSDPAKLPVKLARTSTLVDYGAPGH